MERGFIEFARAATLIVETIPAHDEYATELNGEQKANLTANRFRLPSSESAVSTSPCGARLRCVHACDSEPSVPHMQPTPLQLSTSRGDTCYLRWTGWG
ncbi:hypothetical protein K438DRAFT_1861217, partial [Mycena galopus ATCC 62051]